MKKISSQLELPRFLRIGSALGLALWAVGTCQVKAQTDGTYIGNAGNWGDSANWADGAIAGGVGSTADFTKQYFGVPEIYVADSSGNPADITIGHLVTGNLNDGGVLQLLGTGTPVQGVYPTSTLIFDNDGRDSTWKIDKNTTNINGSNDAIRVSVELSNDLRVENNSDLNVLGIAVMKNHTEGTKWIINQGTGNGSIQFGYSAGINGYKKDSLTGDIGFIQDSETSKLILSGHSNGSASFTGGLIWNKGDVAVSGTTPLGIGGDFVINSNNATLEVLAATTLKNNIKLNADITIDASAGTFTLDKLGNGDKSITTVSGDRILTIKSKDNAYGSFNWNTITDNNGSSNLTLKGEGKNNTGITIHKDTMSDGIFLGGALTIEDIKFYDYGNASITTDDLILNNAEFVVTSYTSINGNFTLNGGTVSGAGRLEVADGKTYTVTEGTFNASLSQATGGSANLIKNGVGTVTFNKDAYYTGTTTINKGKLVVNALFNNSSAITINAGGELVYNSTTARNATAALTLNGAGSDRAILSGTGTINRALVLDNIGDTLSPGNSPGIMSFATNQSWDAFTYQWETNDFTVGVAGTNFDRITITGGLTLNALGDYAIDIISLDGLNVAGDIPNFGETDRDWIILTTTTGITNFDAARWTLQTNHFTSSPNWAGSWSIAMDGNDLKLSYTAYNIPEPSTLYFMGSVILGGFFLLRYRRKVRQD